MGRTVNNKSWAQDPSPKSDHGQKLWSLHSSFLLSDPKVAQTSRLQAGEWHRQS